MVTFNLNEDAKLTADELKELKTAESRPIVYDEDCPELSESMKESFRKARRERPYNSQPVTLYVSSETISKMRAIDADYIGALGRIIDKAAAEYRQAE